VGSASVVESAAHPQENRPADMFTRTMLVAAALAASVPAVRAQAPQFEVVSIKATQPGSRGGPGPFVNTTPGRLQSGPPSTYMSLIP
jgi:hypothetical protein